MQNTKLTIREEVIEINPPQREHALAETHAQREKGVRFLCRHIFTDGHRCGSPALRNQNFCYYHYAHRTPVLVNARRRQPKSGFDLTRLDGLDNPTAIQLAISEVLGRVASNTIAHKSAWLLLYGLQIAGKNLRRSRPTEDPIPDAIVEDGVHGQLAEPEVGRIIPQSLHAQMVAALQESDSEALKELLLEYETGQEEARLPQPEV
jgi:hypothetical protein